jgi:acyl-coenzyme A synthetase/AMP-(fatty) acid ligase
MRDVLSSNATRLGPGPDVLDISRGHTLCTVLANTAELCGDHLAYSDRPGPGGQLRTLTWRQFRETTRKMAAGLIAQGVSAGDRVAIMASNRIEHIIADAAVLHAGAIPVPIYLTAAARRPLRRPHTRPQRMTGVAAQQRADLPRQHRHPGAPGPLVSAARRRAQKLTADL